MNTKIEPALKTLVFVPSRNRADIFRDNTHRWLETARQYYDVDYKVVLEAKNVAEYQKKLDLEDSQILVLPEEGQGLGYSLAFVKEYALKEGYKALWKIDDDIKQYIRAKNKTEKDWDWESHTKYRAEAFMELKDIAEQILQKHPRIGAVGLPYSFQQWQATRPVDTDKKLQTSYLVRTELYHPRKEISTQEDFFAYINVRSRGYHTARLNLFGIELGLEVGGGKGGLQDFNRMEMSIEEKQLIQSEFPNVVFKKKEGKNWLWEVDFRKTRFNKK